MQAIDTFKVDDKTVKIYQDEDPLNPRDTAWQDNCDLFIFFHKRYNLGDKHDYKHQDYDSWDDMEKQIIKDHNPVDIRRIYMYDHSGLTIKDSPFGCPWDSGMIGFALISRKSALKEMNAKKVTKKVKDWAKKCLDSSIESYDNYLRGNCYGYVVEDADGETLDSCWGFIGDIDYVKEEAKDAAASCKSRPKEDPNQLKLAFA